MSRFLVKNFKVQVRLKPHYVWQDDEVICNCYATLYKELKRKSWWNPFSKKIWKYYEKYDIPYYNESYEPYSPYLREYNIILYNEGRLALEEMINKYIENECK